MAPDQLHDLEPDKLFEARSVDEVEQVLKTVDREIEKKKVDLRTLVGERYRDLIEAADQIKEMKELSNTVIRDVGTINLSLLELERRYQVRGGFTGAASPDDELRTTEDAIAAQLSTLIELPEIIWEAVEAADYLRAAQLFLLARHIKTSFDVDRKYREFAQSLVVGDLWRALAHFPRTIVERAEGDLRHVEVTPRAAAVALASVHLLQTGSVLDRFLSLRTESLSELFSGGDNVQNSILGSCLCIVNTLSLVKDCFLPLDTGHGLVWHHLHLISRNTSPINLLETKITMKFLPSIITNFKLTSTDKTAPTTSTVESSVSTWLHHTQNLVTQKGGALLESIVNLRDLNTLKNGYSISDVEWDSLLEAFHVESRFKLWEGLYKPILTQRTKQLVSKLCETTYQDITTHLNNALDSSDDNDLRWFIWKESEEDLESEPNSAKGIFLKSKSIVPKLANICQLFETQLSNLYKDLAKFYNTEDIFSAETTELRAHQQTSCLNIVLMLKEHVRDVVAREGITEGNLSTIARFLQAIPDLCPMLQKCLTLGESKGDAWHEVKLLLTSESRFCWGLWESRVLKKIETVYIPQMMTKQETYADLLKVIPQWEIVWIEEESDHKSQLRIPSAPSLPLQATLHRITTELSRAHLPRLINESVTQKALPLLFACYDPSSSASPSEAFQTLFDLRYLSALYVPLTNKDLAAATASKIAQVESSIDPIDLEVFSPLIRTKVKESVHRTQGMFSTSFSSDDTLSLKIADEPCILALSKTAQSVWFPPLPLANPTNRPLHIAKPKAVRLGKQTNETESSKSSTMSTSFFSDWFS